MSAKQKRKLGELLLDLGLINREQLNKAIEYQNATGHKLGTCLMSLGFISEQKLMTQLTSHTEIKSFVIGSQEIPVNVRSLIPVKKAFEWEVIPLKTKTENGRKYLFLGMTDPSNGDVIKEVQFLTGHLVVPFFVGLQDLQNAYERIYGQRLELIRQETLLETPTRAPAKDAWKLPPKKEEVTLVGAKDAKNPENLEVLNMSTWNRGARVSEEFPHGMDTTQQETVAARDEKALKRLDQRLSHLETLVSEMMELLKKRA